MISGERRLPLAHIEAELFEKVRSVMPISGCCIVVFHGNTVLLLKRAVGILKNDWWFPGGILEKGESFEDCAKRELLEETGIVSPLSSLLGVHNHVIPNSHTLVLIFATMVDSPAVKLNYEHSDYRWFDIEHLNFDDADLSNIFRVALNWLGKEGGTEEARRQREQLDRYLKWVKEEGEGEGPTRLDTWFKPHQQYRLHWLKEHCIGTVMELGTCYGFALAYCEGQIGVDWNEKSISLAKILNPKKKFIVADIRKLPFAERYVDTVMAIDVLEHIPWEDIPQALKEASRVARKKLLITFPDGETDMSDATCFKHFWLGTQEKVQAIRQHFANEKVTIEKKAGFILMEVTK